MGKLWKIGVKDNLSAHLIQQITLSNQIGMGVAMLFSALSIGTYWFQIWENGFLNLLPIIAVIIAVSVLILNKINLNNVANVLLSVLPTPLLIVIHSYLVSGGNPPLAGIFIIQTAFAIIPFLFYDIKSWPSICIFSGINLAGFLSFNITNKIFETAVNYPAADNILLSILSIVIGLGSVSLVIYAFLAINLFSTRSMLVLSNEKKESKELLEASQSKLKDYITKTEEAQKIEKLRIWESEGIAKFGTLLRTHSNSTEVYDILTSDLVKYLEVCQGSIYLVKEENEQKYLEMEGCYAFDRKKYLHKKINIGEGLAGQCYLEKLPTYLEDIPDRYVKIRSGLGDAPPRAIIIIPLIHDDIVEGVLEFASFTKLEKYKTVFLEKLSINIASWISTNRINQETKNLYDKSQEHAQQMHEQEEEMRQNLEELAATQEDMKRKEEELKVLLKASQDQLVQQNLAEIKVQIENDLEGAKRELRFLSNVPPIEGVFRAEDNDGHDQKGNCSTKVWVDRFGKIIQGLLDHKEIYHAIYFYSAKHIISMVGAKENQEVTIFGETSSAHEELAQRIIDCKSCDIYVGEPEKNNTFNFIIQLGLAIQYEGNQRGILILELLGNELIEKIKTKETTDSGFSVKNSKNNTLYRNEKTQSFSETDLNTQIVLNDEFNYNLTISYLSAEYTEHHP